MISRVKDPEGKDDSFVFMLRSNFTDVEKVVMWGINRVVRTDIIKNGRCSTVLIRSEPIAKPIVEKCENVDDMLNKSRSHIQRICF
jgi:hypothetical protein